MVKPMTEGLVPKRFAWQPLPRVKVKDTLFSEFDLNKESEVEKDVDFALLDEMFCRSKQEVEAEEAKKKADAAKRSKQAEK